MPKISDYPAKSSLSDTDEFILESNTSGDTGTKKMTGAVLNATAKSAQSTASTASTNANRAQNWTRDSSADVFSTSKSYAVGDLVIYSNTLYKCTTAHSAGSWASGHFTKTTLAEEITNLNSALNNKQDKLAISTKTVPISFSNSAIGSGSINFSDFKSVYDVFPKDSGTNDIVITRVNNTVSSISVVAYRLTGAITASVNVTVGIIGTV